MMAAMGAAKRENILAVGLGGAMVLMVVMLFVATHYRALLHTASVTKENLVAEAADNGLHVPTANEMCKAQGATAANMASCLDEENQAGEFVIAWMGLNGFLNNGAIDIGQIELSAEIGSDATSNLTGSGANAADPSLGGDPNLGDPGLGDPGLGDPNSGEPNIDPATGLPVDQSFDSPAAIAMYCLSNSMDWLQMHDCISRYDPSTRFTGQ
jgi:hypothetical protein